MNLVLISWTTLAWNLWKQYVDDTFITLPGQVCHFDNLNMVEPTIMFTKERESKGSHLPYWTLWLPITQMDLYHWCTGKRPTLTGTWA